MDSKEYITTVEYDIYSGRPNPTFELDYNESKNLFESIHLDSNKREQKDLRLSVLGYLGVILYKKNGYFQDYPNYIRIINTFVLDIENRVIGQCDDSLELKLAEKINLEKNDLNASFPEWFDNLYKNFRNIADESNNKELLSTKRSIPDYLIRKESLICPEIDSSQADLCALDFESNRLTWAKFHNNPNFTNNCYSYAINIPNNNRSKIPVGGYFCSTHPPCTNRDINCANLTTRAVNDQLKPVRNGNFDTVLNNGNHLVALFVDMDCGTEIPEYHFFRKDRSGYWSNKRPDGLPENRNTIHCPIIDPSQDINPTPATNYILCGYFEVNTNTIITEFNIQVQT